MRYGARPENVAEWFAFKLGKVPLPILDVVLGPVQTRALVAAERAGLLGAAHFGRDAAESYRAFVEYGVAQWDMIARLDEVLRSGRGIDFHEHHTPEEWDAYQRAMLENARAFAWFVVENTPVAPGASRCLDVAGAHGFVGAELCRRHPGMRSTVLDRPEALPRARALAREMGHDALVSFTEGDLRRDDYGRDLDVVLLCNILHHFDAEENVRILRRARAALRPGGAVSVFDIETPSDDARPDAAGDAFALYFRVTSTSSCFRGEDYLRWLAEAGFAPGEVVRSVKMPSRMLVVARAPG